MARSQGSRGTGEGGGPRVSLIMTAWNAASTIERALDSILAEREVPLECVVVDDGSTDDTPGIVERIAARDPRLVLVRAPANEGVAAARNRGLGAARGEWLAFCDADDQMHPGGLAALWRTTRTTDARVVIGQRIWSNGVRTWIAKYYDNPDVRVPGPKSLARNPGLVYYLSATGKLIRRSCVDDLWFFGRHVADQAWTASALLRAGDRVEVIADDVYEWLKPPPGEGNRSVTARSRSQAASAAEAVRYAAEAVQAIDAEAARQLGAPENRRRVGVAYVQRLIRCELSVYLDQALRRRDPDLALLLGAIEGFVRAVPAELIAGSPAFARLILIPPSEAWGRLPTSARQAFWSLVVTARRLVPQVLGQVPRRSTRWALRAGVHLPPLRPVVLRLRRRRGLARRPVGHAA